MAFSVKEQVFVECYLTCWNATEAARRAGYKHPNKLGPRKLVEVGIQEAIKARLAELQMGADEVLTRITDQARATADDFLTIERVKRRDTHAVEVTNDDGEKEIKFVQGPEYELVDVRIDLEKAKERGKLQLIKEYKIDKDGAATMKWHDAQVALTLLAKHHGLLIERTETTIDFLGDAATTLDRKLLPGDDAESAAGMAGEPDES